MANQILRGLTMLTLIVGLGLVTAVSSANGQSARVSIAKVPFEFNVGDKPLPAGQYIVRATTESGQALLIAGKNGGVMRLTHTISSSKTPDRGKLVFHRYGDTYFLSEVWNAGEKTGRQLLKSKQERNIEQQLARTSSSSELAQNRYEIVEVLTGLP